MSKVLPLRAWCLGIKKSILEYVKSCYDYLTFTSILRKSIKSIEPFEIKTGYLENLAGEAIHN